VQVIDSLRDVRGAADRPARVVLAGPATGARWLSAVVVRLPPGRAFPMHTHPDAEGCFFVLAGGGEALGPGGPLPLAELSGVWVPHGVAHGLRAGESGMVEIGFQSPADPRVMPIEVGNAFAGAECILTAALGGDPPDPEASPWRPAFPGRAVWRRLDARHAALARGHEIDVEAVGGEVMLVVLRGAVAADGGIRLSAAAAIRLDEGEHARVRALEPGTHVLAVTGFAS